MPLETFDDLLIASRSQQEPQRLLLVFTRAELPQDATEDERRLFEEGMGGALAPVVCVDKLPGEIDSFAALLDESTQTGFGWDILFVASLPGRGGFAPNADEAMQPLQMMVEAIKDGRVAEFLAVTRAGELVQLQ